MLLPFLRYRVAYPIELRLFNTTDDAVDGDRLYDLVAVVVHVGSRQVLFAAAATNIEMRRRRSSLCLLGSDRCRFGWDHVDLFSPTQDEQRALHQHREERKPLAGVRR